MIKLAIEKLDKEAITENMKVISAYLKSKCQSDEDLCSMILDTDKSLSKCFVYITSEAKKKAKNGYCMMSDEEVFMLSEQYFGMPNPIVNKEDAKEAAKEMKSNITQHKPIHNKPLTREATPTKEIKKKISNDIDGQTMIFDFL